MLEVSKYEQNFAKNVFVQNYFCFRQLDGKYLVFFADLFPVESPEMEGF